jgi:DNA-binding MarR family transcriptional regulator
VGERSGPTALEIEARLLKVSHLIYDCWRRAAAGFGLTPPQTRILKVLQQEDNVPMSRFPEVFPCTKSNVTAVIDSLEEKGLVARQPDAEDRRVVRVGLTEQGRSLAARLPPLKELFADSPTSRLSPDELAELCRLLEKIEKGGD